MKRLILVIIILWSFVGLVTGQSFNLESTHFSVGDIYRPSPKIVFIFAKDEMLPESYSQLDSIALFMLKNTPLIIEIGSHSDSRGTDDYCYKIDQRRAGRVVEYLNSKGVNFDRLKAMGYGHSQLLVTEDEIDELSSTEDKEEAHAVNRRVEFKIITIK